MEWLEHNATAKGDREHVTTALKRNPPQWAQFCHVMGWLDLSGLKLSVDTVEDMGRVREQWDRVKKSIREAKEMHGEQSVVMF
jgi:spore coat polysaccharide biosynthesis protein SpsF (cytidylyltransferase family)